MAHTVQSPSLDRLTKEERLALVEEIWDGIAADPDPFPLTQQQAKELQQRMTAYQADPDNVVPWETVRDDALKRLQQ
jgi:putative addiction module component (TIGR02574 family)